MIATESPPSETCQATCNFLAVATRCADAGLEVFPLHPWESLKGGKHPIERGWQYKATSDPDKIAKWATKHPNANVGLSTTGLLALDVDGIEEHEALEQLQLQYGPLRTMKTVSPSDPYHYHLIFLMPEGLEARQSIDDQGKEGGLTGSVLGRLTHITVKGWHNLVVAPGSIHKTGLPYIEAVGAEEIAVAPQWLVGMVKTTRVVDLPGAEADYSRQESEEDAEAIKLERYTESVIARFPASLGNRHNPMLGVIGSLVCKSLDDEQIMGIGIRWLRHYEGEYGLDFEHALAEFQKCLDYTRNKGEDWVYKPDPSVIELPPEFRSLIEHLTSEYSITPDDQEFLEILFQSWLCNYQKWQKIGQTQPTRHLTLSGDCELFSVIMTLTTRYIKERMGIGKDRAMSLKRRFISLQNFEAQKVELFRRTKIGYPGSASEYVPSDFLLKKLTAIFEQSPNQKGTDDERELDGYCGSSSPDGCQEPECRIPVQSRQESGGPLQGQVCSKPAENPCGDSGPDAQGVRVRPPRQTPRPTGNPADAGVLLDTPSESRCVADVEGAGGGLRAVDAGCVNPPNLVADISGGEKVSELVRHKEEHQSVLTADDMEVINLLAGLGSDYGCRFGPQC